MQHQDKGVTIRNPSTANLTIDSNDKSNGSNADFTISRNNSILNGFFSRIAVEEVVLNWGVGNVITGINDQITFNVNNYPTPGETTSTTITINTSFYTVAEVLNLIVTRLNAFYTSPALAFTVGTGNGITFLGNSSNTFTIDVGVLSTQLFSAANLGVATLNKNVINPVVLAYTYLDFVSNDMTYNQSLKDSTTNPIVRDILYRWYFSWDNVPTALDTYGFPILQGYAPFVCRRALPFPKQIRWERNQPIGNLTFQVYGYNAELESPGTYDMVLPANQAQNMSWAINMLVSED